MGPLKTRWNLTQQSLSLGSGGGQAPGGDPGWTGWLLSVASVAWPVTTREEKAKRETCPVLQEQWDELKAAVQAGKTAGQDAKEQGTCKEEKEALAPRLRLRIRLFTSEREISEVGYFRGFSSEAFESAPSPPLPIAQQDWPQEQVLWQEAQNS